MANTYNRRINLYINDKEVKNNIKSIKQEFYKATAQLNKMSVGSEEYNRQLMKVGKLKGIMDDHNASVRQAGKEWSNTGNQLKKQNGVIGKLVGSAKGLLPAFGWAAVIAGAVKGAKALFNLYTETAKARREAERLTGLSGQPLADFTASVQATADTFNEDFSEVLISTNNFAKTMGISAEEALSKINDGFITGADSSGEFLDILKEYGPQFKAAGLSADESIALITQQVSSGIYSDKGIDAIKEATISLREMTPATKAAIDNIGVSSNELQAKLRDGSISAFEAIQMISNRLAELPPQSTEVGTAIADIFRGAGEDAGLEYITMLGQAELSLEKVKEGAGENAIVQERLLEANTKLKQAWGELMGTGTGTFTAIKATATELMANGIVSLSQGIKNVRDWFIELYNGSLPVRAGFQYMISSWITGFNIVKTAVLALWENLKLGGKLIKAVLTFDPEGIKTAFQEYSDNTKAAVVANAQKVASTWKSAYENTINGKIEVGGNLTTDPTVQTNEFPDPTETTTNDPSSPIGRNTESMEQLDSIDPRIETEESLTDTVLEQTKLRQQALDNEQKAAKERAALDAQLQEQKKAAYLSTLDTIIGVFGEESRIGQAALMAKQAWAIAETIINIAKGTGETAASVPFPANIPLIAGYVAQVAGLIGTIKKATGKTKGFSQGGYTGNGATLEPAGIVHKGEYVVPNYLMRTPAIADMVSAIETMRTSPVSVNPSLTRMFSNGGYSSTSSNDVIEQSSISLNPEIKELKDSVSKLHHTVEILSKKKTFISIVDVKKELDDLSKMESKMWG